MFAARPGGDLDLALERILAHHAQLGFAPLEQRGEDVVEVDLHLSEGGGEELARGEVDLLDRLEQLRAGADQIGALLYQELIPFLLLRVLLEREQVDRAQRA